MKVPLENVWIKIKVKKILKKVTGIENINSLVSTALTLLISLVTEELKVIRKTENEESSAVAAIIA